MIYYALLDDARIPVYISLWLNPAVLQLVFICPKNDRLVKNKTAAI